MKSTISLNFSKKDENICFYPSWGKRSGLSSPLETVFNILDTQGIRTAELSTIMFVRWKLGSLSSMERVSIEVAGLHLKIWSFWECQTILQVQNQSRELCREYHVSLRPPINKKVDTNHCIWGRVWGWAKAICKMRGIAPVLSQGLLVSHSTNQNAKLTFYYLVLGKSVYQ